MFMKTIAVGPLEDVASWVTGGTTVAIDRFEGAAGAVGCGGAYRVHMAAVLVMPEVVACLESCDIGFRNAIVKGEITIAGRYADLGTGQFAVT